MVSVIVILSSLQSVPRVGRICSSVRVESGMVGSV